MIAKREKRKKIFYVPGMISLILIPLFCFYHFYKVDAFKVYGVLDIYLVPDKEEFEKYKIKDLRKYKDFIFNGEKTQELKLQELRYFVRDLVKKYDTVNGAKIHFGSKIDYNTFVDVIDILKLEKVPTWAPYKDDIYVLTSAKSRPKKDRRFFCGTPKYSRENTIRIEEEGKRSELDVFQVSFLKQQWGIFIGYLGIVLLNIFILVKINKTR
ncbi:hypothetical protein QQY79_13845 [Flavobacterium tructae]|uniref:hypothetical protein n=1 Tax=Flavobacterium tructae TaxID=1114873 RepID=UPI002551D0CD|nr:hypothetical protein [Flavobacterium tructae]MDL2143608.1 hypothetical protein [Flavobacterium tructae]